MIELLFPVLTCIYTLFTALSQKRFHSRYNFGYGILLYIRKMPRFRPLTAYFGGSRGVFSCINNKSANLCPTKTEVADFVSFKGSIVQGMIFKHFDIPVAVEIRQNNRKASMR